jgi:hypothetical protein
MAAPPAPSSDNVLRLDQRSGSVGLRQKRQDRHHSDGKEDSAMGSTYHTKKQEP